MSKVLYQKYRPKSFKDIVEQSHVVSILEKAVQSKSPAHAYLFTGSRGIGKTSVARIFAKELGSEDIDIFEIDAASHTSVENMRDITESVYTQPVQSKYKIYIFDEVHMLSKSAFNAFLKTLEEPPEHAIFILVTTEAEKIPDTVVSRCINIEFYPPTLAVLHDTVIRIAKEEGYSLNDESATLIGIIAEGSFRDSLTLLQKILTVSGKTKNIKPDVVEEILGAPRHTLVFEYLNALADNDVEKGIDVLETIAKGNADIGLFAKLCIQKVRLSLLVKEGLKDVLKEHSKEDVDSITELSKKEGITVDLLKRLIDATHDIQQSYIRTLPLEILLIEK